MSYNFSDQETLNGYSNAEYDSALDFEDVTSQICHNSLAIKPYANPQFLNKHFSPVLSSFASTDYKWTNCRLLESSNTAGLPQIGTITLPPLSSVFINKPILTDGAFGAKQTAANESSVKNLQPYCDRQMGHDKMANNECCAGETSQLLRENVHQPLSTMPNYFESNHTTEFIKTNRNEYETLSRLRLKKKHPLVHGEDSLPSSVNVAFKV